MILLASILSPAAASLLQPDEPMVLPMKPNGTPEALPFDEFRQRMTTLANIADSRPLENGLPNRDRKRVLDRVRSIRSPRELKPEEAAILAADWLRLGNTDPREGDPGLYVNKAVDLLAPHTRDRVPHYFVHTTLAQVHAARGEFREACDYQDVALIDCEMPAVVQGWTEAQRNWIAKLDRDYVPHYLRIRKAELDPGARKTIENEDPTPLFPLPAKNQSADPVRFVNDAGAYEPGALAKGERDKLPVEAIAIVQQLLLWFPTDTRLYWLLAELYAADGKLDEAQTIFDQCAWTKSFGNRKVFMEHRSAVASGVDERRKAAEQAAIEAFPVSLRAIIMYFAAVVLIGLIAVVRVFTRRTHNHPHPGCCG